MSSTEMKRAPAPAPAWTPLADLLRSLGVGESGVLRVKVEPPPSREINSWDQTAEPGEVVIYRGWPCRLVESRGRNKAAAGELTQQRLTPPLRPGRYWVPERWRVSRSDGGPLIAVGEVADPQPCNLLDWFAVYPERFPLRYGAHSPATLPARAAGLACEAGEGRVEEWCSRCKGEGGIPVQVDRSFTVTRSMALDAGDPFMEGAEWGRDDWELERCSDCCGEPTPHWCYPVKRVEVDGG